MDIFNITLDRIQKIVDLKQPYQVTNGDICEWTREDSEIIKRGISWYTEGSKDSGLAQGQWAPDPECDWT